jgi:hypothetical protein
MKVFTMLYLLVGIGILVEPLRRVGLAFVATRSPRPRRRRSDTEAGPDTAGT